MTSTTALRTELDRSVFRPVTRLLGYCASVLTPCILVLVTKPCLQCGRYYSPDGSRASVSRCPDCARAREQARNAQPKRRAYTTPAYRAINRTGHCACPGCTYVGTLTVDHLAPISGGLVGGYQLLCRPCNSSKANTDACRIKHGSAN